MAIHILVGLMLPLAFAHAGGKGDKEYPFAPLTPATSIAAGQPAPPPAAPGDPAAAAAEEPARPAPEPEVAPLAVTAANGYVIDDKHKLQAGDKVNFRIVEDREPAKILLVSDSGELDVPYLGLVSATDKTCRQVAQELKALLEKDYYYRATVVLGLDSVSKVRGRVYIWGQVRGQGAVEIPANENFTAGKAILRAGGFGEFAKKTAVKVIRGSGEQKVTYELNMEDILEKGKTEKDITLQPDDLIIVPQRLINF